MLDQARLIQVRRIQRKLHQLDITAGYVAGDHVAHAGFLDFHAVFFFPLGLCQQIQRGRHRFIPNREGNGPRQLLGDFPRHGPGRQQWLLLRIPLDGALLNQIREGLGHLEIIAQAVLLHDADDVVAPDGRPHTGQQVAQQNSDIIFGPQSSRGNPPGESIGFHSHWLFRSSPIIPQRFAPAVIKYITKNRPM